jgi:hypothetical protein
MKAQRFIRLCGWCAALALIGIVVSLNAAVLTVTSLAFVGPGTLRNEIAASSPGDTIQFAVTGKIILGNSLLISHTLYVQGPGPSLLTIDADGVDRAFIVSGQPVFMSGMTISNGLAMGAAGIDGGNGQSGTTGGNVSGGAIWDNGGGSDALILSNCWLTGNEALGGRGGNGGPNPIGAAFTPGKGGTGGVAWGGAVAVGGNNLQNYFCTYSCNRAVAGSGGDGGTNFNPSVAVAGGAGGSGGTSAGGAFTGNFTTNVNCTFSGNMTGGGAGGKGGNSTIAVGGTGGPGGLGNDGGAINNYAGAFFSCTIVSNSAFAGAAGPGGSGAPPGPNGAPGQASAGGVYAYIFGGCINLIFNSILADNYADTSYSNYYATWTDEGYNFIGSEDYLPDCGFGPTSRIGTIVAPIHPHLGPLAQNGGGVPTHATTLTCPVTDQGNNYFGMITTDERGAPRPYSWGLPRPPGGDGSDIGAFELGNSGLGMGTASNNVVLSWPAYYGDFALQSTISLQGSNNWNYLSATPLQVGSQLVVTNPMTNAMMFYRLIGQ